MLTLILLRQEIESFEWSRVRDALWLRPPYVDVRLTPLLDAGAPEHRAHILSPREREILGLLSTGLTGEDVAAQLFLSPETVRTHVRNAIRKLDAKTRSHAVAIAMQRGDIDY